MSTNNDYDSTFKILVLGDSGVGKTCLIYRYTEGIYSDVYVSTIGIDCRTTMLNVDDLKVRMQIWDTAGQERFRTLTSAYYRGAMGVLLVYDVTAEESFSHVNSWLRNIDDNASSDVCKVLVGNKADLNDKRVISKERGEMVAQNNNLKFFETSAKTDMGVKEAFKSLAHLIKDLKDSKEASLPDEMNNSLRMPNPEPSSCC
ncbi:ras-related protein Rab-8A-like [Dendronephthya gigantea]|uniref:ras-related protein Rab-8A-like n=1 Tax=Dendronephthya gigantea TaxID=151771 RepID=UPI001069D5EA|nr:ras-related protein Rab-8A-like [Dendronephthya gigantea]